MTVDFTAAFASLVRHHLHRTPGEGDGCTEQELVNAEYRLRLRLPFSLRTYYLVAGRLDVLNREHDLLFSPAELEVKEGHLLFMEENQAVVHWGMKVQDLLHPDPEVWQRVNVEPAEWYSEELPFSEFLKKTFAWQVGEIEDEE